MRALLLILVTGCLCGSAPAAPADTNSVVLDKARQILRDAKDSAYTHRTEVDESRGVYHFDCSGFVGYILKKVATDTYRDIPHGGHARPLAIQFYQAFAAADASPAPGRVQRIERLLDARPGDVLAWRRVEQVRGDDTGHVVIVDAAPVAEGEHLVRVTILDSTGTGHGNDTRKPGQSGVGRGTMWFETDDAGKPIAYHWRRKTSRATEVPIAIGRFAVKEDPK